jgi:hypothetical protein
VKSEEEVRSNIELFRSRASSAGFFFLSFIFVGMVFQSIVSSGAKEIAFTIAWATFAITTFYALMHKPKIVIFDEGIEIVNPISRHTISWSDVRSIDTRFSLSVTNNDGKKIHAWAAPAPGRYHSRRLHSSDLRGLKLGMTGNIKAGESPKSDSGAAYLLTSARFEGFKARPTSIRQSVPAKFKREWTSAVIAIIAMAALIALR